jgi:hypothetical protein
MALELREEIKKSKQYFTTHFPGAFGTAAASAATGTPSIASPKRTRQRTLRTQMQQPRNKIARRQPAAPIVPIVPTAVPVVAPTTTPVPLSTLAPPQYQPNYDY